MKALLIIGLYMAMGWMAGLVTSLIVKHLKKKAYYTYSYYLEVTFAFNNCRLWIVYVLTFVTAMIWPISYPIYLVKVIRKYLKEKKDREETRKVEELLDQLRTKWLKDVQV